MGRPVGGEVGSFIVRPSMNGGYSMAVRTNTGVQRFFIEEMKEYDYYLSLGGRQYSRWVCQCLKWVCQCLKGCVSSQGGCVSA